MSATAVESTVVAVAAVVVAEEFGDSVEVEDLRRKPRAVDLVKHEESSLLAEVKIFPRHLFAKTHE